MSTNTESSYIPLRLDQFQAGVKSPVNLYARVADKNFVKLFKAGERPARAKLMQHRGTNIQHLWVHPDEMTTLSKHHIAMAGAALNSGKYNLQENSLFISKAVTTIFSEFSRLDINMNNYTLASEVAKHITTVTESHVDLYNILENMSQSSEDLVRYSLTVSSLSLIIGHAMGWRNPVTKEKLAIGGLLHRIGFLDLNPSLMTTKENDYNQEQVVLFEQYPQKGMTKLNSIGFVPDDIVAIVHQHRERSRGKGFPSGLMDPRIHPLARVVAVAEAMAFYLVPNINNDWKPATPEKAYRLVEEKQGDLLNKEIFESVQKVLGRNSLRRDGF